MRDHSFPVISARLMQLGRMDALQVPSIRQYCLLGSRKNALFASELAFGIIPQSSIWLKSDDVQKAVKNLVIFLAFGAE